MKTIQISNDIYSKLIEMQEKAIAVNAGLANDFIKKYPDSNNFKYFLESIFDHDDVLQALKKGVAKDD